MDLKGFWKFRRNEKGFTLVELLVVIAIIGVLATLVLLQLGTARARARDTKRIADVSQIRGAIEQYFEDHTGSLPPSPLTDTDIGPYFSSGKMPVDPLNAVAYNYCLNQTTKAYQVAAELEQKAIALNSDADLTSALISPSQGTCKNGAADTACTSAADDCLYDLGTK